MKQRKRGYKLKKNIFVIGLTGGIASGKSQVESFLSEMGFPVIDGDKVNRALLEKGKTGYKKVIAKFGAEFLLPNKDLNKEKLGEAIFNNTKQKKSLENILHPLIKKSIEDEIEKLEKKKCNFVVYSNPIMIEGKFDYICDKIILVTASKKERIKRLKKRNGFTEVFAKKNHKYSNERRSKKGKSRHCN